MKALRKFLERSQSWVLAHPKIFLGAFALAFCVLVSFLPRLRTELRVYEMKDPAFPSTEHLDEMKNEFEDGNSTIFIFANQDPHQPLSYRQFCAIKAWLHKERYQNHDLKAVFSPFDFRKPSLEDEKLWYRPLLTVDCEKLSESDAPATELKRLSETPWGHVVTNPKNSDLAVELLYSDRERPGHFGSFDPRVVGITLERAKSDLEKPDLGLRIFLTGKAAPQYQFHKAMSRDSYVNFLIIGLCVLLLRALFGTWTSGILFVTSSVISFVCVLGIMAFNGDPLDMLNSNLFLMLCIAGIEDFLFVSQTQMKNPDDWKGSYRSILFPGFLTSLTTFLGFIALDTSDLVIIRRFGTYAGIGAMIECFSTFYLLPAVCCLFPKGFRFVRPEKAVRPSWLPRMLEYSPTTWVRGVAVAAFAAGVVGWFYLNVEDSVNKNFPRGHLHRETFAYTKETRGWESIAQVVFPSSMNRNEARVVLDELRKNPKVVRTESASDIVGYFRQGLPEPIGNLVEREMSVAPALTRYQAESGVSRATLYLSDFNLSTLINVSDNVNRICKEKGCYPAGEGIVFAEFSAKTIDTLLESFLTSILYVGVTLFLVAWHLPLKTKISLIFTSLWGPVVMIGIMALFRVPVSQATSLFASILVGMTGDNAIQYISAGHDDSLQKGVERAAEASFKLSFVLCILSLSFLFLTLIPMRLLGVLFSTGFLVTMFGDLWLLKGFIGGEDEVEAPIAGSAPLRYD